MLSPLTEPGPPGTTEGAATEVICIYGIQNFVKFFSLKNENTLFHAFLTKFRGIKMFIVGIHNFNVRKKQHSFVILKHY